MRRTGKVILCAQCGAERYLRGYHLKRGSSFCSFKCYNLSRTRKNIICPVCSKSFKPYNKLQVTCSYTCAKLGSRNPRWKAIRPTARHIEQVDKVWRTWVFERDNYTCQVCQARGGTLRAHHLNGYHWCTDERYLIDNGITLCLNCHNLFHNKFGTTNCTKAKWFEFVLGQKLV